MFASLAEFSSTVNSLNDYKDAVTAYGELLSITYTPKAEWGTIILPASRGTFPCHGAMLLCTSSRCPRWR